MNIFILDQDPILAAQFHCDRHVNKMLLEACQLMSTAHWELGTKDGDLLRRIYLPSHTNHPCAIWVRESAENYLWTHHLAQSLKTEYQIRFGRMTHGCDETLSALETLPVGIPDKPATPFVLGFKQSRADIYHKVAGGDPVEAYRTYYRLEKARFAEWRRGRECPHWWSNDGTINPVDGRTVSHELSESSKN